MSRVDHVPAHQWQSWVDTTGGVVLDVREAREWTHGTLPGAMTIAVSELLARIDEIPADRELLVVCRSGNRSHQVAAYLNANGYRASNMAGGMKALGLQP